MGPRRIITLVLDIEEHRVFHAYELPAFSIFPSILLPGRVIALSLFGNAQLLLLHMKRRFVSNENEGGEVDHYTVSLDLH
jgi:hypothetical protein